MVSFFFHFNIFSSMAWNRLLSAGLEPVLSQTEKACTGSNYRQFSTNIKIKIIKLKLFHFDIRGKLSIIRCDIYIFLCVQCDPPPHSPYFLSKFKSRVLFPLILFLVGSNPLYQPLQGSCNFALINLS